MAYSKKYGKAFTTGIETLLGFLFEKAENFVIKNFNRKEIYDEFNAATGFAITRTQLRSKLYDLKSRNFIEYKTQGNDCAIRITNRAKLKIIDKVAGKVKSTEKNIYISFDIPERLRNQRDLFRRAIKRMGCKQIQLSLWVTNKNLVDLIETAAQEYGIEEFVVYIVSEKSNIDEYATNILKNNLANKPTDIPD